MAFNPDAYLQEQKGAKGGAFDPDAYLANSKRGLDVIDLKGAGQAALEHYGNVATAGYLPHLQAGAEKLRSAIDTGAAKLGIGPETPEMVDEKLRAQGFNIIQKGDPSYVEMRDENLARLAQQEKDFPKASMAGNVAGLVGGALIGSKVLPGGGATWKARVAQSAKGGGILGAVANPGDAEGEVAPFQLGDRAKNAVVGAAIGAGTQGATEAAGPLLSSVQKWLTKKAGEKATAAIGATKADMGKLGEKGAEKLGHSAREMGIVGPFSTPGRIAKKATAMKDKVGDEIGSLIQQADQIGAPKIDGAKIGVDLLDDPAIKSAQNTPGGAAMYQSAVGEAETLARNGEMTLSAAHALRKRIDQNIRFNKKRSDLPMGTQEVLYKIRDSLNSAINDAVNSTQGLGTDALKRANKAYSQLSKIEEMAENRIAMNSANRTIGLTDTIAAGVGAARGESPEERLMNAVALGGLNKLGRTFGSPMLSSISKRGAGAAGHAVVASSALAQATPAVQSMINRLVNPAGKFQESEYREILNNPMLMQEFQRNPGLLDAIRDDKLRAAITRKIGRQPAGSAMQRRLGQ